MTRKPIGLSIPYRKIGCVQHDCEKCQEQRKLLTPRQYQALEKKYSIAAAVIKALHIDILESK